MYSMTNLTPRRTAILTFIRERIAEHGQSPSLAEISEALVCLAQRGAQARAGAHRSRVYRGQPAPGPGHSPARATARPELLDIPVLGRVAAGAPIGADADIHSRLLLDPALFSRAPDYMLRVQGDSMIEDGILDGDLVGVRRNPEALNGQIVVARLDGEVTIKRFERSATGSPVAAQPGVPADHRRSRPGPGHRRGVLRSGEARLMGAVVALDTLFNGGQVWKGRPAAGGQPATHRACRAGCGVAHGRLAGSGAERNSPGRAASANCNWWPTLARLSAAGERIVLVAPPHVPYPRLAERRGRSASVVGDPGQRTRCVVGGGTMPAFGQLRRGAVLAAQGR
jgi:repressor LexA